jgi:hypothetical protein
MGSLFRLLGVAAMIAVAAVSATTKPTLPSAIVHSCDSYSGVTTISYAKTVPDQTPFPETSVSLCYTETHIALAFTARNETSFYYNASQTTNSEIWRYEVMEAFISLGRDDPSTYLEFEISPGNVTYQAMIYNPSKTREEGAAFDHLFVTEPDKDGFADVDTVTDRPAATWMSTVRIPLKLFNVDEGEVRGTAWRMNFFRTVTDEKMFPDQLLGAWSVPSKASFHMTPFFGHVRFV